MLRHHRNIVSGIMAVGLALGLAACKSEEKKTDAGGAEIHKTAFNTVCPVSLHPVDPDAPTREYQGKTVGFCCEHCPAAWDKDSVAQRDAMMAKVASK